MLPIFLINCLSATINSTNYDEVFMGQSLNYMKLRLNIHFTYQIIYKEMNHRNPLRAILALIRAMQNCLKRHQIYEYFSFVKLNCCKFTKLLHDLINR